MNTMSEILEMQSKGLIENYIPLPYSKIWPDAQEPEFKTPGAAGADLFSNETIHLLPHATEPIGTGIAVAIYPGYFGMICSRSGLAANKSVFVLNAPGIIDSDYRGELKVILHNAGKDMYTVNKGDRIAQLIIMPFEKMSYVLGEVNINETVRGEKGLGSTGK